MACPHPPHRPLASLALLVLLLLPALSLAGPPVDPDRGTRQYAACLEAVGVPSSAQFENADVARQFRQKLAVCLQGAGVATIEEEAVKQTRVSQDVEPLGETPFGEQVNLYSGSLSFRQVDINAPGNGLPIQLIRSLSVSARTTGYSFEAGTIPANGFVDWSMAIPHIETLSAQPTKGAGQPWWFVDSIQGGTQRCTHLSKPPVISRSGRLRIGATPIPLLPPDPQRASWMPEHWWHGYQLMIPGAGSQDIVSRRNGNNLTPDPMSVDGQSVSFPYTTKSFWAVGCLNATSNGVPGQGFVAVSPEGTKYWLDRLVEYPAQSITDPNVTGALTRETVMLLASKVEDRFGNTLTYNYNSDDTLASITASDGRKLAFTWSAWHTADPNNGPFHHITQATLEPTSGDARTWNYHYTTPAGNYSIPRLDWVERPDGRKWQFDLGDLLEMSTAGATTFYYQDCSVSNNGTPNYGNATTGTITAPSGLTGTFTAQVVVRGRSYVNRHCGLAPGPGPGGPGSGVTRSSTPPLFAQPSIISKTFSGAGIPDRSWNYAYSDPHACYTNGPVNQCTSGSTDTVYTDVTDPSNQTTRSTFSNRFDASESLLKRVDAYAYGPTGSPLRSETHAYAFSGPWPTNFGFSYQDGLNRAQNEHLSRENQRKIIQNGNTYTWQATEFNPWAQLTKTSRDNNFDGKPALVESDTYQNDKAQWVLALPLVHTNETTSETVRQNVYNAGTDTLSQRYSFGRKVMDYAWYGNGQLHTFTDANNHTTTLSNYKRGIPQRIDYADGSHKTLSVDKLARINSVTDEASHTTSYQYDSMGRVTYVGYPYDAGGWDARNISFSYSAGAERGIAGGHWKRTVSEGDKRAVTYYNALWQPILTDTWEAGNGFTSHVSQRMDYDADGRTTFQSYPEAGTPSLSALTLGNHTSYDALGRASTKQQNSELGTLTTNIQYLAGNKRKVTDPKNHNTTTTYQAFEKPAYDKPIRVDFNDGSYTSISRDVYGKPASMSQHGTWTPPGSFPQNQSVTHYFAYDTYHRLCKQTSPETGQTGYSYDAADNLYRTAQGLSGSAYACPTAFPYAKTVYRSYDSRDRLTAINYPTGTPDSSFTWYADGKPHTATRGTSTWTRNWYNRGLLKNETLNIDSHNFQLGYSYDSAGHRDAITYPSGMQVNLAPDGRGRPTQLGIWANNINYAPNGRPSAITYGNGGSFSQTLNTRNLVAGTAYSAGGQPLTNRTLSWDANGNPTSISDAITTQAAKLLKPARADWLSASPYSASPFFNGVMSVNTYSAGTDSRSFQYDNLDRMTRLASTRFGNDDYTYDALGNVRSRTLGTTSTYTYDATHNRVSSTPGHGSFSYDDRGNVTAAGSFTLTRNRANELTADALGTSFGYDARGWRVKKHVTTGGTHTYYFIYDNKHRLMERWDNGTRTDFVYLGKKPIARITNNSPTYIFTDYQNSPLFETNSAGTVTRAPNFVGYGHPDTAGIAEIPGYTGAAPDSETGLLYLGARYLEAERFLSPDPMPLDPTSPVGMNRYAYAGDNPAKFIDPNGMFKCETDEACKAGKKMRDVMKKAQEHYRTSSKAYHKLAKLINVLGKPNDGGAVSLQAYSDPSDPAIARGGVVQDPNNSSKEIPLLMINSAKWSSSNFTRSQNDAAQGATGAHEIKHISDDIAGLPRNDYKSEFWHEVRGTRAETAVWQGLGVSDPWFGTWTTQGGLDMRQVYGAARASAEAYCPGHVCP